MTVAAVAEGDVVPELPPANENLLDLDQDGALKILEENRPYALDVMRTLRVLGGTGCAGQIGRRLSIRREPDEHMMKVFEALVTLGALLSRQTKAPSDHRSLLRKFQDARYALPRAI